MDRFITWLSIPVPKKKIPVFVFYAFGFSFIWNISLVLLLYFLASEPKIPLKWGIPTPSTLYMIRVVLAVVYEEIAFRRVPIGMAIAQRGVGKLCLFSLVLSSLIFGYLHNGFESLALQGVTGFICGITFIKCGAGSRQYLQGLAASTAVHMIFNATLIASAILFGSLGR